MLDTSEFKGCPQVIGRGGHLMRALERYECCFLLTEGLLVRERYLRDGRRQIVGLHIPGDVCGLPALHNDHADYDLVALTTTSYVALDRHWLSAAARDCDGLSKGMWQAVLREAAISDAWTVNLGQRPAYQRVAHFACELEARLRAAGFDTSDGVEWPGTQADVGAMTGLSAVHVNRTLGRLVAAKLLSNGRTMRFQDMAKLATVADFDPAYLMSEREGLGSLLMSRVGASGATAKDKCESLAAVGAARRRTASPPATWPSNGRLPSLVGSTASGS